MEKIRIGIVGYGNLGRGAEAAVAQNPDMELVGVFTRRDPGQLKSASGAAVYALDDAANLRGRIDVMILCGGSRTDLPEQGPAIASQFNTVDSYDTHARIPEYFAEVDRAASAAGTLAIISVGWDPGLFSLMRLYGEAILPAGDTATFWGRGVSQGHSDAIRRIPGVKAAVQYTVPVDEAIDRVRTGQGTGLTTRDKHLRDCYVVLAEGANADEVRQAIITMPDYFADYNTSVTFITDDELAANHSAMPHGGFVIRNGKSGADSTHTMEFSLRLDSNPEFTSSVLVAYARAAHRLSRQGQSGARSVLDIAPGLLSVKDPAALRRELL